jgi:hypothetical protein
VLPYFASRERSPVAQFKGASGLLKVCSCKVVQVQVRRRDDQVIESTDLRNEGFDSGFI